MAVIAGREVPDMAGVAVDFTSMDIGIQALDLAAVAFLAADLQGSGLLNGIIRRSIPVNLSWCVAVQAIHSALEMHIGAGIVLVFSGFFQALDSMAVLADLLGLRRLE
jgi:hypothetical protein